MGRLIVKIGTQEFDLGSVSKVTRELSQKYVKLEIEFFERRRVADETIGTVTLTTEEGIALPIYEAALKAKRGE